MVEDRRKELVKKHLEVAVGGLLVALHAGATAAFAHGDYAVGLWMASSTVAAVAISLASAWFKDRPATLDALTKIHDRINAQNVALDARLKAIEDRTSFVATSISGANAARAQQSARGPNRGGF